MLEPTEMTMETRLFDNPIFTHGNPAAVAELVRRSTVETLEPGAIILSDGDPARHVYALERGVVRVFHLSPQGEEVVVKLFRAPAIFGEAEALNKLDHVENVAVIEQAELVKIPVEVLLEFLNKEAACAVAMLTDVAARLAVAAYNEKSLAFNPQTIRLANYLVDYVDFSDKPGGDLHIPLTQDEMAAAVGVTRRSIAKDMAVWQQEGLLRRAQRGYTIVDLSALRRYCDDDRLRLTYSLSDLANKLK